MVHFLHREPVHYAAEDGLPTWNVVEQFTLIDSALGAKREDLLFRKQLVFDIERVFEVDNVECELVI